MDFPKLSPKKEWILTKEAFDRFLAVLNANRDEAGKKYENIRLKLLKYFQWSGAEFPDIATDETINRVIRKIDEGADVYNLNGYIYGVAKLVHTESLKHRYRKEELEEGHLVELSSLGVDAEATQRQECLEHCLRRLSAEDREIIIEYYRYEKAEKITRRKQLADRLGVPLERLRVKMYRQRVSLEECIGKCLGRYEEGQ